MIRVATTEDAAFCLAIYAPIVRETVISFETEAPLLAEFRSRLEAVLASHAWLVYEDRSEVIGYAYAAPFNPRAAYRWSVSVSVYVAEGHRGSGVGKQLYQTLFAQLESQGFHRAFAGITLPNPASVALHRALGFRDVGTYERAGYKLGAWHDVHWMQLDLRPPGQVPEDLTPG